MTDPRIQQTAYHVARYVLTPLTSHIVTTSLTLDAAKQYIRVDATAGPVTVTLPPAAEMQGEILWIGETENTPNAVTIQASGSELIAGSATFSLSGGARHAVTLRSFGTGWDILTTY